MRKQQVFYKQVFGIQHRNLIYNHQGTTSMSVQRLFHSRSFADQWTTT